MMRLEGAAPRDEVLEGVRGFVLQTGQSPAQLAGTAKVCLSVGYRIDNMTVALGSGLLLTALGEEAYGELMGHHLNEGFGTTRRPDLAQAWFRAAVEAVEKGATPVFAPGNDGRNALLRRAVFGDGDRDAWCAHAALWLADGLRRGSGPSFSR